MSSVVHVSGRPDARALGVGAAGRQSDIGTQQMQVNQMDEYAWNCERIVGDEFGIVGKLWTTTLES